MITRIQVTAIMKLALAIALTVLLSQAAMAQVSLPFSDDFNRADENPVGAPYGSIGGGGYRLEGNELRGGGGGSAYVQFSPPAGSYSVSATTYRDLGSTPTHSIGVGFADAAAVPSRRAAGVPRVPSASDTTGSTRWPGAPKEVIHN